MIQSEEDSCKREQTYLKRKRFLQDDLNNLISVNNIKQGTSSSTDSISDSSKNMSSNSYTKQNDNLIIPITYIIDKGKYFKRENKESQENNLEYSCFICKNNNNEIYFYQYVKYNIDDIEDNNFCYRCSDPECKGLITLNYKDKKNKDLQYNPIIEHSIPYKKHSYVMYPTYGYQTYMDIMKQNNELNNIQLVNINNGKKGYYKELDTVINEIKKNKNINEANDLESNEENIRDDENKENIRDSNINKEINQPKKGKWEGKEKEKKLGHILKKNKSREDIGGNENINSNTSDDSKENEKKNKPKSKGNIPSPHKSWLRSGSRRPNEYKNEIEDESKNKDERNEINKNIKKNEKKGKDIDVKNKDKNEINKNENEKIKEFTSINEKKENEEEKDKNERNDDKEEEEDKSSESSYNTDDDDDKDDEDYTIEGEKNKKKKSKGSKGNTLKSNGKKKTIPTFTYNSFINNEIDYKKKRDIYSFFESKRNSELSYGKEIYLIKCHKNSKYDLNRKRWEQYISQKYGDNTSFGPLIHKTQDNIIYKYRPFFFNSYTSKVIKYNCLNEKCEGKAVFDLKDEKFEQKTPHTLSNDEHELSNHIKNFEICEYFSNNPNCNIIQILREYQGDK